MHPEVALLHNYLLVGAALFGIGLVGFIARRNMIVMFLSAEMMLQGVSVSLVAWSRFHDDFGGQMLVIFSIAVAACEAAIALALAIALFRRSGRLDIAAWQELREADQPAFSDQEPAEPPESPPEWPHLPPAGVAPEIPREELESAVGMFEINPLLLLIPALPLAATLVVAALGKRVLGRWSHLPVILALALSAAASVLLVAAVQREIGSGASRKEASRKGAKAQRDFGEERRVGIAHRTDDFGNQPGRRASDALSVGNAHPTNDAGACALRLARAPLPTMIPRRQSAASEL